MLVLLITSTSTRSASYEHLIILLVYFLHCLYSYLTNYPTLPPLALLCTAAVELLLLQAAGLLDQIWSGRESNEETTRQITDLDLPILYILQGFLIVLAFNCSVLIVHCPNTLHFRNVGMVFVANQGRRKRLTTSVCSVSQIFYW